MRRWVTSGLLGALLALAVAGVQAQTEQPRVIADMPLVVMPGGSTPQCIMLQAGTLTVDLQRTGNMGGGAYPVSFSLRPFVVAEALLPEISVADTPLSVAVPVGNAGIYCYSMSHSQEWTTRPESAPRGQMVHLRLTFAPQ